MLINEVEFDDFSLFNHKTELNGKVLRKTARAMFTHPPDLLFLQVRKDFVPLVASDFSYEGTLDMVLWV